MTTQPNYHEEEAYHLIEPYDGSGEPIHHDDEDEADIVEDEDEELEEEEAYLWLLQSSHC